MQKKHTHRGGGSIDYYAYQSRLRDISPGLNTAVVVFVLLFCVAADDLWVSAYCVLTMGWLTVYKGGLSLRRYISFLMIPIIFMMMGTAAIAVDITRYPLDGIHVPIGGFYLCVTRGKVWLAFCIMLKAFGAVSALFMLTLSTPVHEIIGVLQRIHMPKLLTELMYMIYRFIFILMDVQEQLKISAQSRLGYRDFKTSCYSFGHTAGNLLILSLKKAGAYDDAMTARCYDGELRFLEEEKKLKTGHVLAAAVYLIVLTVLWLWSR